MAPVSVTCFMPRASTIRPGRHPRYKRFRTGPWRSCHDASCGDQVNDAAKLGWRHRAVVMSFSSFFRRPNNSLITQLAAACHRARSPTFKVSRRFNVCGQDGGVIFGKAEIRDKARFFLIRQLWKVGLISSTQACSISSGNRSGSGK